jgi:transposase-like protein
MSTKTKKSGKAPATGIRYTDAQKKEIVAFVAKYNADNGRGGQSAASAKYKVTPLTISGWLKSAGVKAPKAKKAAKKVATKAAKVAKPAKGGKAKKGVRYPQEFKNEVVDYVESYNATHGRGGQNQAAKKFKLSVLTVSAWLKAAGSKKPSRKKITAKATKPAKKAAKKAAKPVGKDLAAFKAELLNLIKQF